MVKVIIPRKYGPYKIYDDAIKQINNTNRLLIFKKKPYLDSFLFYSCFKNRIEILDWLLYNDSEIDTDLTKILLYFLKTKGSIAVNLEKTESKYSDCKWVYELLGSVVVEITNKANIIWKLKDYTT